MKILYKSKNAVAVYKPPAVPSQPDLTADTDAMTLTAEALRAEGEGDRLWLVHRLDRVVGGVMVFARNQSAAAELSRIFSDSEHAIKTYLAVVEGEVCDGVMENYIYKDRLQSKAYIKERPTGNAKYCKLECKTIDRREDKSGVRSLVEIRLYTGRFHQIRAQLSHKGAPIVGDRKYGSVDRAARYPALFASGLDVRMRSERITVNLTPDISEYPWCEFSCDNAYRESKND